MTQGDSLAVFWLCDPGGVAYNGRMASAIYQDESNAAGFDCGRGLSEDGGSKAN